MTNGGIIEGKTENSGFSDLSLATSYAGRWINIPDGDYLFGGSGATLRAVLLRKPAIEKETCIRSQHFIFSRSRMGFSGHDAHARVIAVTQRLSSALFLGAGRPACKCEASDGSGGLLLVRHPAPDNFMKYLAILLIGASVSYGQQFNGTVYDLNTGRIQVINGTVSKTGDDRLDMLLEIRANQERWAMERQIREQTRLLREIANQQ